MAGSYSGKKKTRSSKPADDLGDLEQSIRKARQKNRKSKKK